ncbi:MAG: hypothetical protein GXP56_10575 [Deltaproteobacteria bacterium]|nr:hypothetical protein [Deltaproteobacteria bacterium]
MPLSFRTENHGNIAFGFFNIESDMLLLENYFFFADDFCKWMIEMAEQGDKGCKSFRYPVYYIADPNDIGDLMGAIHGVRFKGFIGRVYTLFPFPDDPEAFKQNPKGYQTRKIVRSCIEEISGTKDLRLSFCKDNKVSIGQYVFGVKVFRELIRYVWQGGYPRWKDQVRPSYVIEMKNQVLKSHNAFFKGVFSS